METTRTKLIPLVGDKQKFSAPIFSQPSSIMDVSLSIRATNDYIGSVYITLVYWEDGQKKIIKDYVAGYGATPIEFSINNPTSVPPYILYIESTGIGGVTVSIDADYPLNVGPLNDYDESLLSAEYNTLPIFNYSEFSKFMSMDRGYTPLPVPAKDIERTVNTAETYISPLVVDLDGDGVETLGTDSGVYYSNDNFKLQLVI